VYSIAWGLQKSIWSIRDKKFNTKHEAKLFLKEIGSKTQAIKRKIKLLPSNFIPKIANSKIDKILTNVEATSYKIFLTELGEKNNFRRLIATIKEYKGNRKKTTKPEYYFLVRDYLLNHWGAQIVHDQEADDQLGIEQCKADLKASIICTIDKDLDMIPGLHYNLNTEKIYTVNEFEGMRFFYKQILMGDRADNIPGIYGIGPVRAAKLLKKCKNELDFYEKVVHTYRDSFKGDKNKATETVLEIGQLLYIRKEELEIWQPPKH